jgi:hypothetical protein
VWEAACATFLQLTAHEGHFVAAWVQHAPLAGVSGLLRACVALRWAHDLHCHLLRLSAHLLLVAARGGEGDSEPGQEGGGQEPGDQQVGEVAELRTFRADAFG